MSATVSITLGQLYTVLGNFFQSIVGIDPNTSVLVPVIVGNPNEVSMPNTPFMLMKAQVQTRLRTNVHTYTSDQQQTTELGAKVKVTLHCYGPHAESWSTMITTLWRDYYGCTFLANSQSPPLCQPLFSDDPMQAALVNGEEMYEDRYITDLYLQYNPITTVAQESATALSVTVINVDERYKP